MNEIVTEADPEVIGGFRHRGRRDVSRIESFSDAVFGFSITLLVVSLQVPKSFDELLHTLAGFPAFALTFALLAQIWFIQYRFFRRYALQDGMTIFLNLTLLFVIVYFTYPLKFLFGFALDSRATGSVIRGEQLAQMYAVYAIGYSAVFGIFFLLHAHALRKRDELGLTALEIFETRRLMVISAYQIVIAATSVAAAAFFSSRGDYAAAAIYGGVAYLGIPIGIRLIMFVSNRKRRSLEERAIR